MTQPTKVDTASVTLSQANLTGCADWDAETLRARYHLFTQVLTPEQLLAVTEELIVKAPVTNDALLAEIVCMLSPVIYETPVNNETLNKFFCFLLGAPGVGVKTFTEVSYLPLAQNWDSISQGMVSVAQVELAQLLLKTQPGLTLTQLFESFTDVTV